MQLRKALRPAPVRGRRVKRTLRHIDPWSVLRLSVLFYAAVFLIVCVASAVLWTGARASGSLDDLEGFITRNFAFGDCKPIDGATPEAIDPAAELGDDEDCQDGYELVGGFEFEDSRIFMAFAFGGIVLVLAGSGANVVMVLLFNLMSDLTGGLQVWVVEDQARKRREPDAGSPPIRYRD